MLNIALFGPPGAGKGTQLESPSRIRSLLRIQLRFGRTVSGWRDIGLASLLLGSATAAESMATLRARAESGDLQAQTELATRYEAGKGTKKDAAEAVRWYRRAAEAGHVGAQHNLGVAYANGDGVAVDKAEAAKWYRLAAEQGNVMSQHNLGLMHATGDGVPKDLVQAYRWWSVAAERGFAASKQNLPVLEARMTEVQRAEAKRIVAELSAPKSAGAAAARTAQGAGPGARPSDAGAVRFLELNISLPDGWARHGDDPGQILLMRTMMNHRSAALSIWPIEVAGEYRSWTRERHVKAYFEHEQKEVRPAHLKWGNFKAGERTIAGTKYPVLNFTLSSTQKDGSVLDGRGLFLLLFPSDFETRHRFFVAMWRESYRPGDAFSVTTDLHSIIKNIVISPLAEAGR